MIERLAEVMHKAWLRIMAEQGFHRPHDCPDKHVGLVVKLDSGIMVEFGWASCVNCRSGLVPWSELSEDVKDVNRRGAAAMLCALVETRDMQKPESGWGFVGPAMRKIVELRERVAKLETELDLAIIDRDSARLAALGDSIRLATLRNIAR